MGKGEGRVERGSAVCVRMRNLGPHRNRRTFASLLSELQCDHRFDPRHG